MLRAHNPNNPKPSGTGVKKPSESQIMQMGLHDDIIVISDDDEGPTKKKPSSRTSIPRGKRKAPTPSNVRLIPDDVLEILTSDDDERVLEHPNKKRADGNANASGSGAAKKTKLDAELDAAKREIETLKQEIKSLKKAKRTQLDPSKLEDMVSCEVCTLKLWAPFILPDCGHVFCQSCLQDWFSTTLAAHLQAHPHYIIDPPLPPQLRHLANQVRANPTPQLRLSLEFNLAQHKVLTGRGAGPIYTCPSCREECKSRPAEVYRLKDVVRVVAGVTGETSPRKVIRAGDRDGPWDGFFGKKLWD